VVRLPVDVKAWDELFVQDAHGNLISNLCYYLQKSCYMLRNFFLRFGKRPSTDLDTERSVCGKASPSTTPSRASHDVSIPILVEFFH